MSASGKKVSPNRRKQERQTTETEENVSWQEKLADIQSSLEDKTQVLSEYVQKVTLLEATLRKVESELEQAHEAVQIKEEYAEELERRIEEHATAFSAANAIHHAPSWETMASHKPMPDEYMLSTVALEGHPKVQAAKATTFRLQLWARESGYIGMITDWETGDLIRFSEENRHMILDFVDKHRPHQSDEEEALEEAATIQIVQNDPGKPKAGKHPALAIREESSPCLSILTLDAIPTNTVSPRFSLGDGQPFIARLVCKLEPTIPNSDESCVSFKASVYAKRMGGGPHILLGGAEKIIRWSDLFMFDIDALSLPSGTYRLESIVTACVVEGDKNREDVTSFYEGGIIRVQ